MRVAVATDFSEQAERARAAGVALARKLGDSVALVHSVEPPPVDAPELGKREDAQRRLDRIADAIRGSGVTVDTELVEGYAEEEIAAAAKRMEARLLVVGTHGRRAPLRWLLGSVAERTLQTSETPVLVVGDRPDVFTAWAEGTHQLRVVVALESAEPAAPILEVSRLFHRAGACDFGFVHVASRALLAGKLPSLLEATFRERLADLNGNLHLIPAGESLAGAIAGFLADHPCDLILVGIHPRWELDFPKTAELARSLLHRRIGPVLGVPLAPAVVRSDETPTFHSVLAPTDLSELGNRAVAFAYGLTQRGSVTLLHVHLTPGGIVVPLDVTQRADLELRLLSLVPSDAGARRISTNVVIVEGERPAEAIVDTATRLGCDLICMGSHGRSALGRVVLGSVAEEVAHRFPKPVLIVR